MILQTLRQTDRLILHSAKYFSRVSLFLQLKPKLSFFTQTSTLVTDLLIPGEGGGSGDGCISVVCMGGGGAVEAEIVKILHDKTRQKIMCPP